MIIGGGGGGYGGNQGGGEGDFYKNKLRALFQDPGSYAQTPGYKFQFDQGAQALERSAAAKGMLQSGNYLQDLVKYGQGMASTGLSNYAGMLGNAAGVENQTRQVDNQTTSIDDSYELSRNQPQNKQGQWWSLDRNNRGPSTSQNRFNLRGY